MNEWMNERTIIVWNEMSCKNLFVAVEKIKKDSSTIPNNGIKLGEV